MTTIITKEPMRSVRKEVRHAVFIPPYRYDEDLQYIIKDVARKTNVPAGIEVKQEPCGTGIVLSWVWFETVLEEN